MLYEKIETWGFLNESLSFEGFHLCVYQAGLILRLLELHVDLQVLANSWSFAWDSEVLLSLTDAQWNPVINEVYLKFQNEHSQFSQNKWKVPTFRKCNSTVSTTKATACECWACIVDVIVKHNLVLRFKKTVLICKQNFPGYTWNNDLLLEFSRIKSNRTSVTYKKWCVTH